MRRYWRTVSLVTVITTLAAFILGFQSFSIGNFERGNTTPLGLELGLDLQGGSHLIYRADMSDEFGERLMPTQDQMRGLLRTIERRVNSAGLGEPILQLIGEDRLLVQLPGIRNIGRAKELIGETAQLEFMHRTFDVQRDIDGLKNDSLVSSQFGNLVQPESEGNTIPIFNPGTSTNDLQPSSPSTTTNIANSATSTLASSGTIDELIPALLVEFQTESADVFATFISGLEDSLEAIPGAERSYPNLLTLGLADGIEQPAKVTFRPVDLIIPDGLLLIHWDEDPLIHRVPNSNKFLINLSKSFLSFQEAYERFGETPKLILGEEIGALDTAIGLTGDNLARAYPGQHQSTGFPIVNIEFNSDGTRKFGEITSRIAGTIDQLAIILDGEELIAPVVTQPITGGTAYIQGRDFTIERVRDIALLLEGGRLPVPIELIQERDIDAILGADSLAKSVIAGLVGLGLVLAFMIMYYRAPGLVAAVALVIYSVIVLSIFKIFPITLTLSGVAAAILSVGMAVDANILIFERMKEELRAGRTLLSSINIGFNRAWPAIRDSNVSTLITCAILFWFADTLGVTIVQGFAITLAIGVAVSMFSAITVSRTLLRILALSPVGRTLGIFMPSGSKIFTTMDQSDN